MQHYKTSEIAKIVNVHPNTVRFYEEMKLLPTIPRQKNKYRIYNSYHVEQLRLIRFAFDSELISGNLRKMTIEIIKLAAIGKLNEATTRTLDYKEQISIQRDNAEEAVSITEELLRAKETKRKISDLKLCRREAATHLSITVDVIRDWERNGLIDVPRKANGYRIYGDTEIKRLKVIRTLRNAHYSMMSIRRMLLQVDNNLDTDIREVIDTPLPSEDIISVTDHFITSLVIADKNADEMLAQLEVMKKF
ncbi:MAG: MerR family transcriptional regulator [Suipraeoptans sp.]